MNGRVLLKRYRLIFDFDHLRMCLWCVFKGGKGFGEWMERWWCDLMPADHEGVRGNGRGGRQAGSHWDGSVFVPVHVRELSLSLRAMRGGRML